MSTIEEYRGCNLAALLIHAAFFAYQKSHGRMVGTASGVILKLVIPYLQPQSFLLKSKVPSLFTKVSCLIQEAVPG